MNLKADHKIEASDISLDEVHSKIRSHFEKQCSCIPTGVLNKLPYDTPDHLANIYYEHFCVCNRNVRQD